MSSDEIKKQIDRLFGNTSVPASETRADLRDIAEHVEMLLETMGEGDDGE